MEFDEDCYRPIVKPTIQVGMVLGCVDRCHACLHVRSLYADNVHPLALIPHKRYIYQLLSTLFPLVGPTSKLYK